MEESALTLILGTSPTRIINSPQAIRSSPALECSFPGFVPEDRIPAPAASLWRFQNFRNLKHLRSFLSSKKEVACPRRLFLLPFREITCRSDPHSKYSFRVVSKKSYFNSIHTMNHSSILHYQQSPPWGSSIHSPALMFSQGSFQVFVFKNGSFSVYI